MLAVTTGGEILIAGALSRRGASDDEAAEDHAILARFFAANRVARVPGMLPGVTEIGPELAAARSSLLSI